MNQYRSTLAFLGTAALLLQACGPGNGSGGGGSSSSMDLSQVSSGFSQLLPHQALRLDDQGNPTQQLISIRTDADLITNVTQTNPILPVPQYPVDAILPSGDPGNHFVYVEFTSDIDVASVLDGSPGAQSNGNLTGTITLVALDPTTGAITPVQVRAFVNGFTYGTNVIPGSNPPALPFEHWVAIDTATGSPTLGRPIALEVPDVSGAPTLPGANFPGVAHDFNGAEKLISPRTIVFVADTNGDLTDNETFPSNRELRLRVTTAVRNTHFAFQKRQATVTFTVGPDTLRPEVARTPPPLNEPLVTPSNGTTGVDPLTNVRIEFTEDIQPWSLGALPNGFPPLPSSALSITFGPSTATVTVPFNVKPISVYDLTTFELIPAFNFPGEGPDDFQCGVFNRVTVGINPQQISDLVANQNLLGGSTFFETGEGPGLVNAPVLPDTIYVARSGSIPGLSALDLNGFGQSTGNPTFNQDHPIEGNTNFPNNPNVRLQGALMRPPEAPGTCTINGGSAGVFTLTKDSSLNSLLVRAPILTSIGDMMIGHALDSSFNNGPAPFGCQAGGGNICAFNQLKIINPTVNGNTLVPTGNGQINGTISAGAENLNCWAPHPNPPTLNFPPLCISPYIGGQEPTSVDVVGILNNMLGPGDPFGEPNHLPTAIPPSGLLTPEQNAFFEGPSYNQTQITSCLPYMIRQQIGQFLYVIDRGRQEVVVMNSNRMTVIDRIPLADPTTLAMSPNINLLAVANQLSDLVSFIDIDPNSATFHQIVQETIVGHRPRGIAWEPGDEDILVCNEFDNSMSIISAASLTVRKTVSSQLDGPFEVAVTPRQLCWGFSRLVYFGWVLNRSGRVAIFESGPNSVNGWGYDNIIGIANSTFHQPKTLQPDHVDLRGGVWIVHEGPIDISTGEGLSGQETVGAVSKLVIVSAIAGPLPLNFQSLLIPQFRDMFLGVPVSLGADKLSGVPVDIAFDDLRNMCGLPNLFSAFTSSTTVPVNGKGLIRGACPNAFNNNEPRYMFVAVPTPLVGTGVVDVIRIDQNNSRVDTDAFQNGTQSIPAPDVQVLMDYFRE